MFHADNNFWETYFNDKTPDNPVWPGSTYDLEIYGEEDYQFKCDGTNPGVLVPALTATSLAAKKTQPKARGQVGWSNVILMRSLYTSMQ